jgi:hypothetical protein
MLLLGEVHTGLLQNSTSVSHLCCAELLALILGERVRRSTRPIAHAVSPDILTGVDCQLPSNSRARVRGVGTVASHAAITGGHVLQGSTVAQIVKADADHRLPWSHYLSRPGIVEAFGRADLTDLAGGAIAIKQSQLSLDLSTISGRLMDAIQGSQNLDRRPPFKMARTRLRWVAIRDEGNAASARAHFAIENDILRTLHLTSHSDDVSAVTGLCEDLALHDWLLTTLLLMIEASRIGDLPESHVVGSLKPAIDCLLHLWMPAARMDQSIAFLWEGLERRSGFTRQWQAMVNRVRDQAALATIALLQATAGAGST